MQTQSVKESGQTFHTQKNKDGEWEPHGKTNEQADNTNSSTESKPDLEGHIPQNTW